VLAKLAKEKDGFSKNIFDEILKKLNINDFINYTFLFHSKVSPDMIYNAENYTGKLTTPLKNIYKFKLVPVFLCHMSSLKFEWTWGLLDYVRKTMDPSMIKQLEKLRDKILSLDELKIYGFHSPTLLGGDTLKNWPAFSTFSIIFTYLLGGIGVAQFDVSTKEEIKNNESVLMFYVIMSACKGWVTECKERTLEGSATK